MVSTFIDDIKIKALKESGITQRVQVKLIAAFSIADMGPISFYLGLKVEQDQAKQTIKLLQPGYIDKIVVKFYLDKTYVVNTPMNKTALLQSRTEGQDTTSKREQYQGMTSLSCFP